MGEGITEKEGRGRKEMERKWEDRGRREREKEGR